MISFQLQKLNITVIPYTEFVNYHARMVCSRMSEQWLVRILIHSIVLDGVLVKRINRSRLKKRKRRTKKQNMTSSKSNLLHELKMFFQINNIFVAWKITIEPILSRLMINNLSIFVLSSLLRIIVGIQKSTSSAKALDMNATEMISCVNAKYFAIMGHIQARQLFSVALISLVKYLGIHQEYIAKIVSLSNRK